MKAIKPIEFHVPGTFDVKVDHARTLFRELFVWSLYNMDKAPLVLARRVESTFFAPEDFAVTHDEVVASRANVEKYIVDQPAKLDRVLTKEVCHQMLMYLFRNTPSAYTRSCLLVKLAGDRRHGSPGEGLTFEESEVALAFCGWLQSNLSLTKTLDALAGEFEEQAVQQDCAKRTVRVKRSRAIAEAKAILTESGYEVKHRGTPTTRSERAQRQGR